MTRVWVLDTETTGVDKSVDKIVELGGVLLEDGVVVKTYESLVNPGMDIPPEASAVHHIRNRDVENSPGIEEALAPILAEDFDYAVAHNAKFDAGFLPSIVMPWVCTWKVALRAWPEAPAYSNQVLRYWLDLPDPVSAKYAHRALYDAEVTSNILLRLLSMSKSDDPMEKMAELCSKPALLVKVNFGQHRGMLWSELPRSYLTWVLKNGTFDEDKAYTAKYWLDRK